MFVELEGVQDCDIPVYFKAFLDHRDDGLVVLLSMQLLMS